MSVTVPYHVVSQALLPSALGARVALNRQLGIPYQNSLLLSKQSFYVRVVDNQFKLPLPVYEPVAQTPPVTISGKYAQLKEPTTSEWITFTAWMGYGAVGPQVIDPWEKTLDTGDLLINSLGDIVRIGATSSATDTHYPDTSVNYLEFIPDGTLALLSELITDRIADLPDVVNDVNADINFIPRTIISGLEPMLRGFTL